MNHADMVRIAVVLDFAYDTARDNLRAAMETARPSDDRDWVRLSILSQLEYTAKRVTYARKAIKAFEKEYNMIPRNFNYGRRVISK